MPQYRILLLLVGALLISTGCDYQGPAATTDLSVGAATT